MDKSYPGYLASWKWWSCFQVPRIINTIILLTDFNDDVRLPWIRQFFANVHLTKALTEITGPWATATHNCGQAPIDEIFVSPELLPMLKGVYLTFNAGIPSNHQALWIDLPSTVLEFDEYTLKKPQAHWLQCKDPRVVATYLTNLSLQLTQANTFHRIEQLLPAMTKGWLMWEQQQEYESLDCTATSARIQAEWQCRKLKMGKIPWSPDLMRAINWVLYWKGMILRANGHQIGTSVLHTPACKGGFEHNIMSIHLLMETLQDELAKAYCWYHQLKKEPHNCDTWIGQLIEAQAPVTWQKKKKLWKQIQCREQARLTARQVKFALGKLIAHQPLAIVSEPVDHNTQQECTQSQPLNVLV